MAIRLADTARPNNYVDKEHPGSFPVAYAEDIWFEDGTRLSEKTFGGDSIQVDELPLASAEELGNIYQYVGVTGTYTKGYFYECVSDGEVPPTYSWKEAVGGSGYHFSEDFVEEEGNVSLAASQRIFTGTEAEWDALSTAVKKTYGQVNIVGDSVNKVNSDGSLSRVAGGTLYADAPIGVILPYGGTNAPSGWLICRGQAISRTEYSELFAVIGTAFGKGNESTTFNVPDLREAVPKGTGLNAKGAYHYDNDGIALGEFVDDRIKSHAHNVYVRDTGHAHGTDSGSSLPSPNNLGITKNSNGVGWGANPVAGTASNTQSVSANIQVSSKINFGEIDNATTGYGYATNEVKAVGANYIIKAKQVAVPADFIDAIDDVLEVSELVSATNTEYTTHGSIVWKRSGNVVEVTFMDVTFASQMSGDVILATGLPPSKNYSWNIIKSLTSASNQQGVAVDTSGNLSSLGGSTGGSGYYDSFTYLAAN